MIETDRTLKAFIGAKRESPSASKPAIEIEARKRLFSFVQIASF
jgi:hypothetical protein